MTSVGTPKAGVFAEGAARVVAASIIAELAATEQPARTRTPAPATSSSAPAASARVDVDFLSGPLQPGPTSEPSADLVAEKKQFGASRRARWFR